MTVAQLVARFLAAAAAQVAVGVGSALTVNAHRSQLAKLPGRLLDLPAGELSAEHLSGYRGVTRHHLASVERLYNWGHAAKAIPANPIGRLAKPRAGVRSRVLSRPQAAALLWAAPKPFRLFLILQRRTLMRPGELRALRWADVELEDRVIVLRRFKAMDRRRDGLRCRVVPLGLVVVQLLTALKRNRRPRPCDRVFPGRRGEGLSKDAVCLAFRRAAAKAGIDQSGERAVCYTVRHTAATDATRNGVRDRLLADIMGHTSTATTARYQHLDREDLVEAIDRATARPVRRVRVLAAA